jgi:hypothetical protein
MKISLHIEADTAEEMAAALAVFHVKQLSADEIGLAREDALFRQRKAFVEQEPAPVAVSPVPPQATPEPESPKIEPSEALKQPVDTKKRGRPFKAVPVEEAPVEAPVAPPVAAQPPKTNGKEAISRQDLLDVFAEYVQRYSANYGYTDISNLLQQNFGGAVRKASDVLDTQLPAAVAAIKAAIIDNPFNRKRDYA